MTSCSTKIIIKYSYDENKIQFLSNKWSFFAVFFNKIIHFFFILLSQNWGYVFRIDNKFVVGILIIVLGIGGVIGW